MDTGERTYTIEGDSAARLASGLAVSTQALAFALSKHDDLRAWAALHNEACPSPGTLRAAGNALGTLGLDLLSGAVLAITVPDADTARVRLLEYAPEIAPLLDMLQAIADLTRQPGRPA